MALSSFCYKLRLRSSPSTFRKSSCQCAICSASRFRAEQPPQELGWLLGWLVRVFFVSFVCLFVCFLVCWWFLADLTVGWERSIHFVEIGLTLGHVLERAPDWCSCKILSVALARDTAPRGFSSDFFGNLEDLLTFLQVKQSFQRQALAVHKTQKHLIR